MEDISFSLTVLIKAGRRMREYVVWFCCFLHPRVLGGVPLTRLGIC